MEKLAVRLIINLDGMEKSYFLWNGTESYYNKLRSAYIDIKNDKKTEYLYFGFFALCASTLEFSLNFVLTDFCLNHFGHENYKSYAEGYINLPFAKKLLMTPSIVSNGQYTFDQDNSHFKSLLELITLRNRILHNKEFLKEFDCPPLTSETGQDIVNFQIGIEPNHIDTLTKDLCIRFGDALGKFKSCLMKPATEQDLSINEMLVNI